MVRCVFKARDKANKLSKEEHEESYDQHSLAGFLKSNNLQRNRVPEKSSRDILKAEIFQFQNGKQLQLDCALA